MTAVRQALIAEFGEGTNLGDVALIDVIDVIVLALLDAGHGDDSYERAEDIALRLDGSTL